MEKNNNQTENDNSAGKPKQLASNNSIGSERTLLESALIQISECAVTTYTLEDYCKELHGIIKQLTYAENFFVALYEQGKSLINFVYVVDEYDQDVGTLNKLSSEKLRRTITGYMLRTGSMQHLTAQEIDFLQKKNVIDAVGADCVEWLGIPLKYNDEVLGGLVIQSYRDDISYGPQEEDVMQFVARHIALVFKSKQSELSLKDANAVLEKRVEERTRDLNKMNTVLAAEVQERKKSQQIQAALYQITELVSTSGSLKDLFQSVHKIIERLMYARNEYIALLTDDNAFIEFPYFVDEFDASPPSRRFDKKLGDTGFTEKILTTGESFLFHHDQDEKGFYGSKRCVSWLGVPLKDKQHIFGVLAIQSYQEDIVYSSEHQMILLTIGQQVATAILRKKDADSLRQAHENLERRVKERTFELEETIEKRKLVEKRLAHESLHDSLTGLPNRLQLSNVLNDLLDSKQDKKEIKLALLFLDLDRFKIINDSLGHHVGDLFLIEVAKQLKQCIRSDDLVARLGGDEFCILMPDIPDDAVALRFCARILNKLRKPVEVAGHSLITSASVGVRLANSFETSAEVIMSDADAAMYQAKHQGKNRYCFFDSNIKKIVTNRMKMERDLRDAVSGGQLFLEYQPLVELQGNRPVGFEALVRWRHPESGLINPGEFIPVAEETGLIVEIGEAVIEMACRTLARFKATPHLADLYLNVNVSSIQILSRTLDDFIRHKLDEFKITPDKLNVEITESILIEDYKAALSFVRELKSMGIKVYLDDFGTGYSSLSYLHKFPFDAIKLDRSFIIALEGPLSNQAIVESIALLANNLGIHIVAEGIETKEQLELIKKMDYSVAQGFYFSKPITDGNLLDFVQKT
ncbi:bifunctional diguanylate cyclase/phosphodiesterase [Aliikangiella coralliicola]|uniref:EAL domain-containing protein n=1 Tax=Aliikangiella coralliicola TaxID=2592383 RepID=A0A545UBX7_9GAMM|nr:EAL domain-containing protein [Aliikangiella coralliicola]TQV86969.1 EAL domain-containing protein [Aliikangiella coralliicola]